MKKAFTAIIERCLETGRHVGHVPGFAGAQLQGASLNEMLLEDD